MTVKIGCIFNLLCSSPFLIFLATILVGGDIVHYILDKSVVNPIVSYRVFIKYCVFSKILKYIPDSGLSRIPLGVSVCTQ